jgi:leucyl/phenylalanyl-tRNA---protein transferase
VPVDREQAGRQGSCRLQEGRSLPNDVGPSKWDLPPAETADEYGIVGVGADLEPSTLLAAYRNGIFPMPVQPGGPMGWWSPDPRAIVPLDGLRVSRSLRRSCGRFEVRIDTAFADVIHACADRRRPGGWITNEILEAYVELHRLGWAHSVEAWSRDDNSLCGGLYGVAIGGLFAGESMFHRRTDASKAALVGLVERLQDAVPSGAGPAGRLLDVQWRTDHLASLGAVDVSRASYLDLLGTALQLPLPVALR